jgi:hypothetical protein
VHRQLRRELITGSASAVAPTLAERPVARITRPKWRSGKQCTASVGFKGAAGNTGESRPLAIGVSDGHPCHCPRVNGSNPILHSFRRVATSVQRGVISQIVCFKGLTSLTWKVSKSSVDEVEGPRQASGKAPSPIGEGISHEVERMYSRTVHYSTVGEHCPVSKANFRGHE